MITTPVRVTFVNCHDQYKSEMGRISPEEVRTLIVEDAVVDTRMSMVAMPMSRIAVLGLPYIRTQKAIEGVTVTVVRIFGPARLSIQDRDCPVSIVERPDGAPVTIGRVPLHALDLVIDPDSGHLVGNPLHGGEPMIELYGVCSGR